MWKLRLPSTRVDRKTLFHDSEIKGVCKKSLQAKNDNSQKICAEKDSSPEEVGVTAGNISPQISFQNKSWFNILNQKFSMTMCVKRWAFDYSLVSFFSCFVNRKPPFHTTFTLKIAKKGFSTHPSTGACSPKRNQKIVFWFCAKDSWGSSITHFTVGIVRMSDERFFDWHPPSSRI